jgi:hypothetical protein
LTTLVERAHSHNATGQYMTKSPVAGSLSCTSEIFFLEFFEEVASRAGNINSARDAALTVLDAFHNTCGFGALRTVRALVCVHDLLAVAGLGNLRHNA